MTWHISAAGHTPTPADANDWADVEEKLFGELQAVLSKPEYGASTSEFHGNNVHGNPHAKPEDSTHTHERSDAGSAGTSEEPAPAL
jgi:hypothetical protein